MFITLEGSEGCGKTTQSQALAEFLRQKGYDVLLTREPGGTAIGEQIRAILANPHNTAMQLRTEILLFQASRAQLVEEVIRPHLARKGIVVCDRYADSTLAYQGYGYRQIPIEQIRALVEFATGGLEPDLTFLLDLEVEIGLRRRAQDGAINRLDTYELDFYRRIRAGYLELAHQQPKRWVVVDATPDFDQVQAELRRVVLARLPGA
ncbi:MAG: dTMP kinase [Anaerolineales bacterium]|nr:dTMP kinase [Anaerolineales bacterium]MCS7249028.1 dTMP kinase [Anaerolineales bacterium]MDW8162841.1 dTMP kinase [Anaerolineales bacterium]MDW8447738.1 dTMP kinase [Anaerolineales bacterium]